MVVAMRRYVVALAVAGTMACSYVFELPASSILPVDTGDAATQARDAGDLTEAGLDPVDAGLPFCPSQTTPFLFCADFDESAAPSLEVLGTVLATNGTVAVANVVSFSPPRSLVSTVNGADASGALRHPLGASLDALTLSFQLLVSAWNAPSAVLSQIELEDETSKCVVRLGGGATSWSVTQVCTAGGVETARLVTETNQSIELGKWHRFALSVKAGATKTVTLDIDGARVTDVPGLDGLHAAAAAVTLGVTQGPSGSVAIFQDNVLVTSP